MKLFSTFNFEIPNILKIIKIIDIDKINFTLFIEYFESAFVNDENDFSSTSTF